MGAMKDYVLSFIYPALLLLLEIVATKLSPTYGDLIACIIFIVVVIVLLVLKKVPKEEITSELSPSTLFLTLSLGFAYVGGLSLFFQGLSITPSRIVLAFQEPYITVIEGTTPGYLITLLLLFPIACEFAFRYLSQHYFRNTLSNYFPIIATALMYGVFCFARDSWIGLLYGVLTGTILGLVAEIYVSIWPAITLHIGMAFGILMGWVYLVLDSIPSMVLGGIMILVAGFLLFHILMDEEEKDPSDEPMDLE